MNLQAKQSVFRSRKSQQKKHAHRTDLATTFLGERLRIYNARMAPRRQKRGY